MEKLTIIDADFIPYFICYNKKNEEGIVEHEKTLEEVYKGIDDYIDLLLYKTQADKYIGYLSNKKTFRNTLASSYKAQRKPSEINYLKEAKLYMEEKYKFKTIDNIESDDSCLITENLLKDKYYITIISPDKDIKNTFGNRYDPKKDEFNFYTQGHCDRFFWTSMIVGDTADNIKGIPKSGPKAAEAVIQECDEMGYRYSALVFDRYIAHFGESKGIEEFYKNYKLLYILREYEGFEIKEEDLITHNYVEKTDSPN